jgi:DNA-binding response OmpR family regulator
MDLLLVEDEEMTSHVMTRLLRRLGIKVDLALTVMPAIEKLARLPDVVVLDLPLADGSGLEVFKMIRDTGLKCRVAVITSANDPDLMMEIQALKPGAIFQKPLNFEDFGRWLCDLFPQ